MEECELGKIWQRCLSHAHTLFTRGLDNVCADGRVQLYLTLFKVGDDTIQVATARPY